MLDSIFALLFVVAFVLQLISVYEKSIIFCIVSLVMWLTLMVNSLYIEVPYHVSYENVTGSIVTDTGAHVYNEFGVSALCLGFVFINLVLLIIFFLDWKESNALP